jgi:hypothetical protein
MLKFLVGGESVLWNTRYAFCSGSVLALWSWWGWLLGRSLGIRPGRRVLLSICFFGVALWLGDLAHASTGTGPGNDWSGTAYWRLNSSGTNVQVGCTGDNAVSVVVECEGALQSLCMGGATGCFGTGPVIDFMANSSIGCAQTVGVPIGGTSMVGQVYCQSSYGYSDPGVGSETFGLIVHAPPNCVAASVAWPPVCQPTDWWDLSVSDGIVLAGAIAVLWFVAAAFRWLRLVM